MKNKKRAGTIGVVTLAIILPVIGRAIGQSNIQSEYSTGYNSDVIFEEKKLNRIAELESFYENYKEYMGLYKLNVNEDNYMNLLDSDGNIVVESIMTIKNVNFSHFLISSLDGYYIFNTNTSELSQSYSIAAIVYIQRPDRREPSILYKVLHEDKQCSIQSSETLYENFDCEDASMLGFEDYDVSSGIPKKIE